MKRFATAVAGLALLAGSIPATAAGPAHRTRPGARVTATPGPVHAHARPALRVGIGYHGWYGYRSWPSWSYPVPGHVVRAYHRVPASGTFPGAIETDVRPKRARVRVDGKTVGQARDFNGSWDLLYLEPGEYALELSAEGHRTLRRNVLVRPGGYVHIRERLERGEGIDPRSDPPPARPAPARTAADRAPPVVTQGLLRIRVEPPDAAVYLDGRFLGRADELTRMRGDLPVAVGEHVVEVVRPGYSSATRRIEIVRKEPELLRITLEPTP